MQYMHVSNRDAVIPHVTNTILHVRDISISLEKHFRMNETCKMIGQVGRRSGSEGKEYFVKALNRKVLMH